MTDRMMPQPPERQTRLQIERELGEQKRRTLVAVWRQLRGIAKTEAQLARLRKVHPGQFAKLEEFERAVRAFGLQMRRKRRRPDDGGMPALVEPPRGPLPLQGGAEAPLEFD